LIPLALVLLFHGQASTITISGKHVDVAGPVSSLLNPIDVLMVLLSWAAGVALEVLLELRAAHQEMTEWHKYSVDLSIRWHNLIAARLQSHWIPSTDFDQLLMDIRERYERIVKNAPTNPDLFSAYYAGRLSALNHQIRLTSEVRELPVNQLHFDTTDILLGCLSGKNQDTDDFLAVHYLNSNAFLLEAPHATRYARLIADKVTNGEISVVRRLFIVDDDDREIEREQIHDEFTIRYVAFHANNFPHYDYRIIGKRIYQFYLNDNPEEQLAADFGIYGHYYVYETTLANSGAIEGTFRGDRDKIKTYRNVFNRCWEDHGKHFDAYSDVELPGDIQTVDDVFREFFERDHRSVAAAEPGAGPTSP